MTRKLPYLQSLIRQDAEDPNQQSAKMSADAAFRKKFIDDDGEGLRILKEVPSSKGKKRLVTDLYSVEMKNNEWLVYDANNEVVGEWDTEAEAVEHANAMQESDDVA